MREPLKPFAPADDQEIVFPWASAMVIIVLLKLAFMCATPEMIFFRSRRRILVVSLAISVPYAYFFLPAIGFAGPLRVRALVCVR